MPYCFTEDREVFPLARMAISWTVSPSMTAVHMAYSSFSQVSRKPAQSSMVMSMVWTVEASNRPEA